MLKMAKRPCRVTIFEGPDGSGKTTLAKKFASQTDALYVHFEAYTGVEDLHKFFIEAMLPALLGYQDVVFDRCWHSGPIYDRVLRNLEPHEQRLTPEICTLLDRAAAHCQAVIVNCRPPEEVCMSNWSSRVESELVKSEFSMQGIYKMYGFIGETTKLPCFDWDYTGQENTMDSLISRVIRERAPYKSISEKVHFMVSSGEKTNRDVMIDIPGVRFGERSNEFKLAKIFNDVDDQNVSTEELIRFIPIDANLFEYFNRSNHAHETQYVVAIGEEAISAFTRFRDESQNIKEDLVDEIFFTPLLNIEADTYVRKLLCLDPLSDVIRRIYDSTPWSSSTSRETEVSTESENKQNDITVIVVDSNNIKDVLKNIIGGSK